MYKLTRLIINTELGLRNGKNVFFIYFHISKVNEQQQTIILIIKSTRKYITHNQIQCHTLTITGKLQNVYCNKL